jgi:hypothetical protein
VGLCASRAVRGTRRGVGRRGRRSVQRAGVDGQRDCATSPAMISSIRSEMSCRPLAPAPAARSRRRPRGASSSVSIASRVSSETVTPRRCASWRNRASWVRARRPRSARRYHGTTATRGGPTGPRKSRTPDPDGGSGVRDVSRHHSAEREGFEPPGLVGRPLSRRLQSSALPPFRRSRLTGVSTPARRTYRWRDTLGRPRERCQSGRMGRPAKALTTFRWSVGSNPTLSATCDPIRAPCRTVGQGSTRSGDLVTEMTRW